MRGRLMNCGMVDGGIGENTIPDSCEVRIGIRFPNAEVRDEIFEILHRATNHNSVPDTTAELDLSRVMQCMDTTDGVMALFRHLQRTAQDCGFGEIGCFQVGGLSDSGITVACGVPTVCGMGVRGEGNHTPDEYAEVESLFQRSVLAACAAYTLNDDFCKGCRISGGAKGIRRYKLMANKEKQAENKEKIGIGAWLALIVLILVLSGAFRTAEGPIKVLDFTNLAGSFGQIGDTGANLIGKGGTGAKDGFMAGFNLIPAVMFFCGLLGVFEQLGAFKASDILFRPLLRPLLGIPGKCGIAFISSFTGSDVAAVMTRELYEDGEITDDERTIFVAYQYAGSACINNTITGGAPLVAICPVALGPCIVIMFVCKLIGANIVRLILRAKRGKA